MAGPAAIGPAARGTGPLRAQARSRPGFARIPRGAVLPAVPDGGFLVRRVPVGPLAIPLGQAWLTRRTRVRGVRAAGRRSRLGVGVSGPGPAARVVQHLPRGPETFLGTLEVMLVDLSAHRADHTGHGRTDEGAGHPQEGGGDRGAQGGQDTGDDLGGAQVESAPPAHEPPPLPGESPARPARTSRPGDADVFSDHTELMRATRRGKPARGTSPQIAGLPVPGAGFTGQPRPPALRWQLVRRPAWTRPARVHDQCPLPGHGSPASSRTGRRRPWPAPGRAIE